MKKCNQVVVQHKTDTGNFDHVIEVNSDDADGQSVSNYEYESRLQDKKRQIKLLDKAYLNTFVEEFERLVKDNEIWRRLRQSR